MIGGSWPQSPAAALDSRKDANDVNTIASANRAVVPVLLRICAPLEIDDNARDRCQN